ncbi:MAG: tRNA pseudouridine(38-40) synthase TruA [Helicobacteraceae bacterium]|nr:tRNA pseudouridine(38-40) synthase TruA [Helicobacteraceae bacterium]
MKAKVTIAYDGSRFFGSQPLNKNGKTVLPTALSVFEDALKGVGIFSAVAQAGRTDRFVHARGQVFGFSLPDFWTNAEPLKAELDKKLYPSILIRKIEIVGDDFHPRFSAKSRVYRYLITANRPSIFTARYIAYAPDFDLIKAKEAIAQFIGAKDFYHFSKRGSDEKTTIRSIRAANVRKFGAIYIATFEGDSFLRSQVRLMMAAVLKIAAGKAELTDISDQFAGKSARFRNPAPAEGLYLAEIRY